MSNFEPVTCTDKHLIRFARVMKLIPRKPLRCEIYGTVTAIVDERHAKNIFNKVAPGASSEAIYAALGILRDRLDERF